MLKQLLAATLLLAATAASATTFTFDPERTIAIVGPIGGEALFTADRIIAMSESDSSRPIQLFINSPGGAVLPGMQVIAAMDIAKTRGVKVQCFVSTVAASMAFHILGACDERYTLRTSLLLWHPAAVTVFQARINKKVAKTLYVQLNALEKALNPRLIKELGISEKVFYMHHNMETFHPGIVLQQIAPKFLTLVDDVKGVKGPLFVPAKSGGRSQDDDEE